MRKCGEPRRVDSQEAATARPHDGAWFREPSSISSRHEVSEPNQVGVKPLRERSCGGGCGVSELSQPLG
jgi:hypothetical protein